MSVQFFQEWRTKITSISKLNSYCKYKVDFSFEKYLEVISIDSLRNQITR